MLVVCMGDNNSISPIVLTILKEVEIYFAQPNCTYSLRFSKNVLQVTYKPFGTIIKK